MVEVIGTEPFREGYEAYKAGKSRRETPYASHAGNGTEWENGWDQARHCDKDEDVNDTKSKKSANSATPLRNTIVGVRTALRMR